MIQAVIAKERLLLLRDAGFRVVLIGYLLVFVVGYLVFYSELAAMQGAISAQMKQAFGKRVLMSQAVLLTVLTPWVVSRAMLQSRGDHLVRLIALTFLTPWKMVFAKLVAVGMYLAQLLLLSLPVMVLTYLLGAATVNTVVGSYMTLFVWLTLVQLSTLCRSVFVTEALPAFVLAYATLCVLSLGYVYLNRSVGDVVTLLTVAGLSLCVGLALRWYCNKDFVYLNA